MRKIVLYIIYGDNQDYYNSAKYSLLTFMSWLTETNQVEFFVLTEKPEEFDDYPVTTFLIDKKQKNEWSLGGAYHFRIKNRGLLHIMDKIHADDKILFFDADTYFVKSPLPLFDLINSSQALLYLNEGLIYSKKKFSTYVKNLADRKIEIDNEIYELSKKSSMWGSLMIGVMPNMKPSIEYADQLLLSFFTMVPSHTIEQFSLAEALIRKYNIIEGKNFISQYSTSRKKKYVNNILKFFFKENDNLSISDKISLAKNMKLKRPLFIIFKQHFF